MDPVPLPLFCGAEYPSQVSQSAPSRSELEHGQTSQKHAGDSQGTLTGPSPMRIPRYQNVLRPGPVAAQS